MPRLSRKLLRGCEINIARTRWQKVRKHVRNIWNDKDELWKADNEIREHMHELWNDNYGFWSHETKSGSTCAMSGMTITTCETTISTCETTITNSGTTSTNY
jgi:hypothetical protein